MGKKVKTSKQWFKFDENAKTWTPLGKDTELVDLKHGSKVQIMIAVPYTFNWQEMASTVIVARNELDPESPPNTKGSPFLLEGQLQTEFRHKNPNPESVAYGLNWYKIELGEVQRDRANPNAKEQFRIQVASHFKWTDANLTTVNAAVAHDPVMRVDESGG